MEQLDTFISGEQLSKSLDDPHRNCFVVDNRPSRLFKAGHIVGALNLTYSILQWNRLNANKLTIINLFATKARKSLEEAVTKGNTIVIYDDDSTTKKISPNITLIRNKLIECLKYQKIVLLDGGYNTFSSTHPNLTAKSPAPPFNLVPMFDMPIDHEHPKRMCIPQASRLPDITHVEGNLYLGNSDGAKNRDLINKYNIRYIINVTPDFPNHFEADDDFHYKRISVKDTFNQDINTHFQPAIDFIEEAEKKNVGVLVHCAAGISRSATIVLAYLMQKNKKSMNDTYESLKTKRDISPNLDFMGYLLKWEKTIDVSNSDS